GNHRQNRSDQSRTAKTWLSRGSELTVGGIAWLRRSAPRREGHSHPPQPSLTALGGGAWLQRHCHREQFPSGARSERVRVRSRFIPTHKGQGLPTSEIAALPTRSGSMKNPTYFALRSICIPHQSVPDPERYSAKDDSLQWFSHALSRDNLYLSISMLFGYNPKT